MTNEADGWQRVVEANKVTDGSPHGTKFGDVAVGVFEIDGDYFAIGNVCTHAFALLTNGFQEGCLVECPLHAGFFDIRSGKAQGGIVETDLPTYPVKVEDGWIFVQLAA
jgi:nitrite reductase/ring-hydroxylating ferredoxin subunit